MKKVLALLLTLTMAVSLFAGCGGGKDSSGGSSGSDGKKLKIGFCVAGTLGDKSTNDQQYEGLKKYQEESGCELIALEAAQFTDHEVNARNLAEQGCDLVIMGLQATQELVETFAGDYPDTVFWINNGTLEGIENVACTRTMPSESNFLTGAFAVYMTEYMGYGKTVGWIGGQRNPALERAQYGFTAGAEYAGGEATLAYVGNFVDTSTGKELAGQMYDGGIHIIQGWAGGATEGVMQASQERLDKECYCMRGGSGEGDFYMGPDAIIACATENADQIIYEACKQFAEGKLPTGEITYLGLDDNVSTIIYNPDELGQKIPQEVKDKVQVLIDDIISGKLVPPTTEEEYNKFEEEHLK